MPSTATAGRISFLPFCCNQAAARNAMNAGIPLFQAFLPIPVQRSTYCDCIKDGQKIDPCCGSGHILCCLFDVLIQIYRDYGIQTRDAVRSIVEKNIWGLDIDDRAAQLSYFSVMMKAVQYDPRFLRRKNENGETDIPQPNIYAIKESNHLNKDAVNAFNGDNGALEQATNSIINDFYDAKEYGSIIAVNTVDFHKLFDRFYEIKNRPGFYNHVIMKQLYPLVKEAQALTQKYDVVVTNPPYMGSLGMGEKLSEYIREHFPDSKNDFFSVFMEKADEMVSDYGYTSLITMESWMFLSSFEPIRLKTLRTKTIINMVHMPYLGKGGTSLGINFGTAAVVMGKGRVKNYKATYEYTVYYECDDEGIPKYFPTINERWGTANQDDFSKIPGSPIAYWMKPQLIDLLKGDNLGNYFSSQGRFKTCNDEKYLRMWWEVSSNNSRWHPYIKGGDGRKYRGNEIRVIDWSNEAQLFYKNHGGTANKDYWNSEGITWATIGTSALSFRIKNNKYFNSSSAPTIYLNKDITKNINILNIIAYLNTKPVSYLLDIFNPTASLIVSDVLKIPYNDSWFDSDVQKIAEENIKIASDDWNLSEISREFSTLVMVYPDNIKQSKGNMRNTYEIVKQKCNDRFQKIVHNQELINKRIIGYYNLEHEITPNEDVQYITIHSIYDKKEDIPNDLSKSKYVLTKTDVVISFISYAVGCMFGRYSLDEDGLVYAGGEFDGIRYKKFPIDRDNIIPITDDEYFPDDIVNRFISFVEVVYGNDTLDENLEFIAEALGGKGTPREVIRNYFLNDFYKDHCKTYQKRPIYWLFDAGKKNSFKCLIYMHRYQPDTLARIRTDYVHEQQGRYRTAIEALDRQIETASSSDRARLNKKLEKLRGQAEELRIYEEKIHHLADQMIPIDLDDGVKHNYAIFQDVLAKIK